MDLWYRLGRLLSKIFLPTFGTLTVVGRQNLPKTGPVLIAVNHQNDADPAVLVYAIDRPIWFMAKRGLFAGPIAAYFLRRVHVFPVDRDGRDIDALLWAQATLDKERALVIFPEGTRSPGGLMEPTTDGTAYIALRSGVPIVPVGITGTENIRGMFWTPVHFKKLHVTIGEPFTLPPVQGRIDRRLLHEITHQVMERIAAVLPEEYRGFYAEPREGGSLQVGDEPPEASA
jgi:1-acyl-sn-glycerol-3-phosphate acyltransferase